MAMIQLTEDEFASLLRQEFERGFNAGKPGDNHAVEPEEEDNGEGTDDSEDSWSRYDENQDDGMGYFESQPRNPIKTGFEGY